MGSEVTTSGCALPSLLLGSGHIHGDHQLYADGTFAPGANPWLKQLADDVTCAMRLGILPLGAVSSSL